MNDERWRAVHQLVVTRVTEVDPDLPPTCALEALDAAASNPRALSVIAHSLKDGPAALRRGAPPLVGRLVKELRARGSVVPEPTCSRCARTGLDLIATDEGGMCERCRRRQLATACGCCGVVKPIYGRGEKGEPLCSVCAPRPERRCSRCHRVKAIARRAHDEEGELCVSCFQGGTSPPVESVGGVARASSSVPAGRSARPARRGGPADAPTAARTARPVPAGPKARCASPATGRLCPDGACAGTAGTSDGSSLRQDPERSAAPTARELAVWPPARAVGQRTVPTPTDGACAALWRCGHEHSSVDPTDASSRCIRPSCRHLSPTASITGCGHRGRHRSWPSWSPAPSRSPTKRSTATHGDDRPTTFATSS